MTLLLSRRDLVQVLDVAAGLDALRAGFAAPHPTGIEPFRVRTDLPADGTATALLPGLVDGVPAYTVKVNAKFPGARPALRGVVCLHDLETGELLAVLDSATVTAWRTGLAAALGTHLLARTDAVTVGVIGAGVQADLTLRGLSALRAVSRPVVYDIDEERARTFWSGEADVCGSPSEVAQQTDIAIVATWARTPVLSARDHRPGMHITSLGADEPGKAELTASLLRSALVFVDDVRLAVSTGALGNVGLGADCVAATSADVVRGSAGRSTPLDRTVYAPVGLPWQDLALSWIGYRAALNSGVGTEFDFLL